MYPAITPTGSSEQATRASFQPKAILLVHELLSFTETYATMVPLVKFTSTVRIEPRLTPDRPDIAVASVDNIVVKIPVLCSRRSKKAVSCRIIDRKE